MLLGLLPWLVEGPPRGSVTYTSLPAVGPSLTSRPWDIQPTPFGRDQRSLADRSSVFPAWPWSLLPFWPL